MLNIYKNELYHKYDLAKSYKLIFKELDTYKVK